MLVYGKADFLKVFEEVFKYTIAVIEMFYSLHSVTPSKICYNCEGMK